MDVTALLADHPVVDGHNDLLWTARVESGYDFEALDVGVGGTPTHTDLPRLRAGGVGAQFWSVYVPTRLTGDHAVSATLEQVDAAYALTARYADRLVLARTAEDVEAAWASGRIASLMGAEGGHSIDSSLGTLRQLRANSVQGASSATASASAATSTSRICGPSATESPASRSAVSVFTPVSGLDIGTPLKHAAASGSSLTLCAKPMPGAG